MLTLRAPGSHRPYDCAESVGRLVRAYDDAAFSFAPPPDVLPEAQPARPPGIPPAPAYPPELIGHVDITPENVVFRDGRAYALIDFDLGRPATRADDMFNAMMWWAPLSDPRDVDWQRMWDEGVGDAIKRREAWLDRHAATLTAALTAP